MLDHTQGISAFAPGLTTQLVHEGAHEENPPASHSFFPGIEVRNCSQVERISFIEQADLQAFGPQEALDLNLSLGLVLMSVTDNVVDGFVNGQDDGIGSFLIQQADLTHGLDKSPSQVEPSKIAR
jgi:hypothetical protein